MWLKELMNMHGYGIYVWSSYAIVFIVFIINLLSVWREKKTILSSVSQQ